MDISIVIPFHNEEKSLKELLPLLKMVIKKIEKKIEIILIDDCSSDNSFFVAKEFAQNFNNIFILRQKKKSGQTGCYKKAFEQANGEYIIRMDADLQDDPRDLAKFIDKIDGGFDLVMGLREVRKHRRILRLASMLYDMLIVALFNSPFHSNSGSYVTFKTSLVKDIPWHKNDHRYLPLIAMHRGAKKVGEVMVAHNERKWGESKYKPVRKIIFGIPEVFLFLVRYFRGVYNIKH